MKKSCLILLLAMFLASCSKYEPLHFPRTPYEGNELRTDGFWYHVGHSQYVPDWMSLYFLYRNGFQNWFHDTKWGDAPHFRDLRGTPEYEAMGGDKFYFQFGYYRIW